MKTKYDVVYLPLGSAGLGGAERSLLELATKMHVTGNKVLILIERRLADTPYPDLIEREGIEWREVAWAPENSLWQNIRAVKRELTRIKAPLIHFNISWRRGMWVVPLVAKLFTNMRLLGTMRAMPEPHAAVKRKRHFGILPGLQLWHLPEVVVGWFWGRLLHITVSINKTDFPTRLQRDYYYDPKKIRIIYNGIPVATDELASSTRANLRRSLHLPEDAFLVCFAGRLTHEKGVHVLIEALQKLQGSVHAVIVGSGPEEERLTQTAKDLGIAQVVHFLGFCTNSEDWMAASDVVVVPSLWNEPFGRVVIEAMNQGTPVIAARIGGMGELLEEGKDGLYVDPGDAVQLAEAIAKLQGSRPLVQAMAEAGRANVRRKFSVDRVFEEYRVLYAQLGEDQVV